MVTFLPLANDPMGPTPVGVGASPANPHPHPERFSPSASGPLNRSESGPTALRSAGATATTGRRIHRQIDFGPLALARPTLAVCAPSEASPAGKQTVTDRSVHHRAPCTPPKHSITTSPDSAASRLRPDLRLSAHGALLFQLMSVKPAVRGLGTPRHQSERPRPGREYRGIYAQRWDSPVFESQGNGWGLWRTGLNNMWILRSPAPSSTARSLSTSR